MHVAPNTARYLLRWRFDFRGGSTSSGMWSSPGDIEKQGAWRQQKAGLVIQSAAVEGKDVETRRISALVTVPGHDFVMFEWTAEARVEPLGLVGAVTPLTMLTGLSIVTYAEIVTVSVIGDVSWRLRPAGHKTTVFATYGK